MSKEYRYRKFIRWGQYVIPVFFGFLLLVLLGIIGSLFLRIGSDLDSLFVVIFSIEILVLLLAGVGAWYMYYRLAGVVVSIDNDGVVYKYRGGIKRLPFESLRVDSSSIRYSGGWLKIISGKDVIRLTVVVENIGEFVQELKAALDSRGLSSHYDSQKLFGFMKTAAYSDQSWDRAYIVFGKLYLIIPVIVVTIANGYIFGISGWAGLFGAIGWGLFSLFWATGAYIIAEIKLGRKIATESSGQSFSFPQRDLAYEKYVYDQAIKWGGWLYFGISLLVFVGALAIKVLLFVQQ
jgi:hypothetical protein